MEVMIWVIPTIIVVGFWVQLLRLAKINAELLALRAQVKVLTTVRQQRVASSRSNKGTPVVDAKARTTVRDSHDLPTTGRMSTGIQRKLRKVDDGNTNDV